MNAEYITQSPEETEALGERLGKALSRTSCIALFGGLGAGKTTLVRGIARGLGIQGVTSPTYTIVNEYEGQRKLCHFDMYRIGDADALYDIGWEDYLASGALCVIEWSQHVESALPQDTLRVEIVPMGDRRRITIHGLEQQL